jgi:hypothetical protein
MSEQQPEMDRLYPELVRLAYLVLPGAGSRKFRLALARRIAEESLPRRAVRRPYRAQARARRRALARAMRPRRRLRVGLGRWVAEAPSPGSAAFPDPPAHLAALAPEVRAAYVMRRVEGRYRYEVQDQLVELGVRDAKDVVQAADLLAAPPAPIPVPPVLRGPRLRSRIPVATAMGLTAVLVGAIIVTEHNESRAHQPIVAAAPRSADRHFAAAALAAWRGAVKPKVSGPVAAGPPSAAVQVLYAGRLDGAGIALLRDRDRLARYVSSGGRPSLELFPAYGDGAAPLVLADGRYLVPPGVTAVRATALSAGKPVWHPVAVRDGVTDPVTAGTPTGCWSGPILSLHEADGDHAYADLAGPATAAWSSSSAGEAPPSGSLCALPRPSGPALAVSVQQFWKADLPDGTPARWICARYTLAGGAQTSQGALLEHGDVHPSGSCVTATGTIASGVWWRPGGKGHWYHLTAAEPGLHPAAAYSKFGSTGHVHGLLVGVGPSGGHPPKGTVTITTHK